MAAYLTTFVALRYLQRNQWPRPSILGTVSVLGRENRLLRSTDTSLHMFLVSKKCCCPSISPRAYSGQVLKCTAAGMVGAFATSGFAIRTTFPKVLELDESILADRLCPALGAFRPCLERADCRKLLQDRMEPFIVCQEACQRRTSLFRGPAPPGDFAGDGFSDGAGGFGDGGSGGFGGDGGGGGATDGGDFGASDGGDGCSGGSFGGITDVEPESGAYGDTGSGSWGDAVSGGVGGGNGTGWAGGAGKL
ncbi:unnamed protein product [Phaeothamnion confervicola]